MPIIYLSPSTQEFNPYITGAGSEEYFMNRIADDMEPWLRANTIRFTRNTPQMTAASSIAQANRGNYDLYLALHSNASGDGITEGRVRGVIAFYYPTSRNGRRAAEIFAKNLKAIYPLPEKVTIRPTTALGEVRQPKAPSVLLELGYHDNRADALWVEENIRSIAENLVRSLTEYFALPFIAPLTPQKGTVITQRDNLNLRAAPSVSAAIVTTIPRGATVSVYGVYEGWYSVGYGETAGYVARQYVRV